MLRPAHKGLIALGVGVLAWDVLCPPGETLTAGVAELQAKRPGLVFSVVMVTAAHLVGVLPAWCDPFGLVPVSKGWGRRS